MRVIIYGLGAIGGCVGALLMRSGVEVIAIARGAMLQAVQAEGLRMKAPDLDITVALPSVSHPSEIDWRPDDLILMCMKTQHMAGALEDLRASGVRDQHLFCLQNGVTNEDMALRLFPNVHGSTVMMPATYLEPGKVVTNGAPKYGVFDLGRYPGGCDAADHALAGMLDAAGMAGFARTDVMASKHGKLLVNLTNVIEAALGHGADFGDVPTRAKAEAQAVFAAAGIAVERRDDVDPAKRDLMNAVDVPGESRSGGSSAQSLLRGAGSIETDYLNGEVVRLGRLHGVETPVNAGLQRIGARLLTEGLAPGSLTLADLTAEIG